MKSFHGNKSGLFEGGTSLKFEWKNMTFRFGGQLDKLVFNWAYNELLYLLPILDQCSMSMLAKDKKTKGFISLSRSKETKHWFGIG